MNIIERHPSREAYIIQHYDGMDDHPGSEKRGRRNGKDFNRA